MKYIPKLYKGELSISFSLIDADNKTLRYGFAADLAKAYMNGLRTHIREKRTYGGRIPRKDKKVIKKFFANELSKFFCIPLSKTLKMMK